MVPINGAWSHLHAPAQPQPTTTEPSPSPTPAPTTQPTSPHVSTTPAINLTGHENNNRTRDGTGTQDTLDSTVFSFQCSFHQEVERFNNLWREVAKANAQSLLDMQAAMNTKQTEMDSKLVMMDQTICTVHKGKKLNDENIQLLMQQFAAFGAQMQMMQNVQPAIQTPAIATPSNTTETPTKANETVPDATHIEEPSIGDTRSPHPPPPRLTWTWQTERR